MKLLGLNSPEIFIILVILLIILGPKRIEKAYFLFKKILKFLLSKEETIKAEVKSEEPEESEVKEETIKAEVKSKNPKKRKVKKEIKETELKLKESKTPKVKDEIVDLEVNSEDK